MSYSKFFLKASESWLTGWLAQHIRPIKWRLSLIENKLLSRLVRFMCSPKYGSPTSWIYLGPSEPRPWPILNHLEPPKTNLEPSWPPRGGDDVLDGVHTSAMMSAMVVPVFMREMGPRGRSIFGPKMGPKMGPGATQKWFRI